MTQAEALYHLQEIELGVMRGQKRLQEIAAALEDSEAVKTAQGRVHSAEETLRPLHTKMRNLELEIQSNIEKTQSTESRLYSGNVKNPKELQDMQQEIESLKKWHQELESRLLDIMVVIEDAEAELNASRGNLQSVTTKWEAEHQDLLGEKNQLEERVKGLLGQRKEAITRVTPENLKTYSSMKPRKNNQPMAIMNGKSCAVCGIEQTMAIEQEVRRGHQLVPCLSCGRILVYSNS